MNPPSSVQVSPSELPKMSGPRQPKRCRHHLMRIPAEYSGFESEIEQWISTCVTSRTKTASGKPMRREKALVEGNPTLKSLWSKLKQYRGTNDFVKIDARYSWLQARTGDWIAKAIQFSTNAPALRSVSGLNGHYRSIAIDRELHALEGPFPSE